MPTRKVSRWHLCPAGWLGSRLFLKEHISTSLGRGCSAGFEAEMLVISPLTGGKLSAYDKEQVLDFQALRALAVALGLWERREFREDSGVGTSLHCYCQGLQLGDKEFPAVFEVCFVSLKMFRPPFLSKIITYFEIIKSTHVLCRNSNNSERCP